MIGTTDKKVIAGNRHRDLYLFDYYSLVISKDNRFKGLDFNVNYVCYVFCIVFPF